MSPIQKLQMSTLIGLLAFVGVMLNAEFRRNSELSEKVKAQNQQIESQQKNIDDLKKKISDEETGLRQSKDLIAAQEKAENQELQEIKNSIDLEKGRLDILNQKVIELKTQLKNQNIEIQPRVIQEQNLAKNLEARLRQAQNAEKEVSSESDSVIKNNKSQVQQQQQLLNSQIQGQQALVASTQNQLNFWRGRKGDINQVSKVIEYQQTLVQQNQILQQLRTQKIEIGQQDQNQTSTIKQAAAQEKEGIRSSEAQLQNQLQRVRQDLKALQDYQLSEQKFIAELKNRLHFAEQDYAAEAQKFKLLQDDLAKKQADLKRPNPAPAVH